jgi:XTP/dITP diphosphohydrolase
VRIETIVLASDNANKAKEIQMLLGDQVEIIMQQDLNIQPTPETGKTFQENACLKATTVYKKAKLPVIGDDSGLEVDCLNGQPGIHSARFAGEDASDKDNIIKLLSQMTGIPPEKRTARFKCVIALVGMEESSEVNFFHGEWNGFISEETMGHNGFGYDPVFVGQGTQLTAAELDQGLKNKFSHRGQAMEALKSYLSI